MGCGLNKLEKRDETRPGNIYSTLKRPQVETKTDVSCEYRFLEFTTLSAAALPWSSAVRLASLRELPAQLLDLYQQGFSLAALHPFVQPTQERERTPLEHIFRAVLIKKIDRSQKADLHSEGYTLELDCCSLLDPLTDQKLTPELIKKVQEAASRGLKFVGVVSQYCTPGSVGSSPPTPSATGTQDTGDADGDPGDPVSLEDKNPGAADACPGEGEARECPPQGVCATPTGPKGAPLHGPEEPISGRTETFALFNKPTGQQRALEYYPVTIPLRVSRNGQTVSGVDANWLEHTSDHFRKGGVLVNAAFCLGAVNDSSHGVTDGVFIFEAVSADDGKTTQGYDAIVVEQWTVLEGTEVRTDYVPLLNSLAAYGWELTCVLPTPVIRTTREGSVSTKQIVFLQRPCLPQKTKRKEARFQWRFSREDMRGRQKRKSVGKPGARDTRQAQEDEKDADGLASKAGDAGDCAPNGRREGSEQPSPVHNGPATHTAPGPGEDAGEPATAEDN
ncbi:raftlin [Carlito syrichta]|uniref:Raftlin n=1 Tax=Carlito syrichta TaxID=1868482 RepID=A0A1U7TH13_CARSF|nr:raftlin [Carlito syrichta]